MKKIFKSDKFQHLRIIFSEGSRFEFYHAPVSLALRQGVQGLSDLLHIPETYHAPSDAWWEQTRSKILGIYRLASICSRGNLLCPALISNDGVVGMMAFEAPHPREHYAPFFVPGAKMIVAVNYLDEPPAEWKYEDPET